MKYLCLFLSCVLIVGCKKYPEGGFVKRGPKNILGKFKLTLYEVNGIDSTELINYNNDESYKIISFLKNVSSISIQANNSGAEYVQFVDENRKLTFGGSNSGIKCTLDGGINYCFRNYLIPEANLVSHSASWDIVKLKPTEIKLRLQQKNNYKITLSFTQ